MLNGMKSAAIVDDKMRLRLLDNYVQLQAVLTCLRSTVETGKLAKEQLRIEEEKKSWLQRAKDRYG